MGACNVLASYMDCLFSETRGIREGFPPEVLSELIALKRYHDNLYAGPPGEQTIAPH